MRQIRSQFKTEQTPICRSACFFLPPAFFYIRNTVAKPAYFPSEITSGPGRREPAENLLLVFPAELIFRRAPVEHKRLLLCRRPLFDRRQIGVPPNWEAHHRGNDPLADRCESGGSWRRPRSPKTSRLSSKVRSETVFTIKTRYISAVKQKCITQSHTYMCDFPRIQNLAN